MQKERLYAALAQLVGAYQRCLSDKDQAEWAYRHKARIRELCDKHMPHDSGLDADRSGRLDLEHSTEERLVFWADFHHMDENGYYDGWTDYTVKVDPSLAFGFTLRITGRDRNDIKEYLHQVFNAALSEEVEMYALAPEASRGSGSWQS
jgi:hypothetical protein